MSETPETDAVWGDPYAGLTDCKDVSEGLEIARNSWRSVAEQFYEAFDALDFERFKATRAAFDSLRKEATGE